ncbi:tensin-4 [Pelodytes ibericus]
MSQVIPNHVLRVGQTVSLASKEEGGSFGQEMHPMYMSMTNKCSYFSTERHTTQISSQPVGTILRVMENGPHSTQSAKKSVPVGVGINTNTMQQGMDKTACDGGDPLSPSLDISIDNLNQLILQLDPTFKPLPIKNETYYKRSSQTPSSCIQSMSETPKITSPPEIKCVEMNSKRAVCHENIQRSTSPVPRSEGILISRGTKDDNCTPNGSVIFSESNPHASRCIDRHRYQSTGGYHNSTESIDIPLQKSNRHNTSVSSSLGSEYIQNTVLQFRTSEDSILSCSPGSDTSYILGSTQSLVHDDIDGQHLPSRTTESPFGSLGSFSQLSSPGIMSPSSVHYFDHKSEICGHNPALSRISNMSKTLSHTKGHANSCPPSVASSSMDIPILLVNGCLENDERSPNTSTSFFSGQRRRGSSSFNRGNKTYSDSSISTCSDSSYKDGKSGMKFVMATSKQWFKPSITRDKAIEFLKDKEPGTFLIRDSTSFRGSFGLAMKIPGPPSKAGKDASDLVRHFLIESSAKGVHLKGASDEPYFGSLSALVHQHSISPLSLPCKLIIPDKDQHNGESSPDSPPGPAVSELNTSAACNVLYLNSVSTETLTGSSAIQKAVSATFEQSSLPMLTIVHFKANEQGVTLTDVQRKVFFRRHYPLSSLSFCSVDPELRKWQKHCRSSRIFGFVAKNPSDATDNVCHIFAEYDAIQPVSPLISFLTNLIQQQEKV